MNSCWKALQPEQAAIGKFHHLNVPLLWNAWKRPSLLLFFWFAMMAAAWSGTPVSSGNTGILDIGLFQQVATGFTGNKLKVKLRPTDPVVDGVYSEGKFTLRCLTSYGVDFTVLETDYGFEQIGAPIVNGAYSYYLFSNVLNAPYTVNWTANTEIDLLTLGYDCLGNATFEIIDDAYVASINGDYYQELDAANQTGLIYQATAVSAAAPAITAGSNSPLCEGSSVDLFSNPSGGSGALTYAWDGPNMYSSMVADPPPFAGMPIHTGAYAVTMTDGNGCTASATTNVSVYALPTATISGSATIYPGDYTPLTITFTGDAPWNYQLNGVPQPAANSSPVVIQVSPPVTSTYTVSGVSDAHCPGSGLGEAIITVRAVNIDVGIFPYSAPSPAGNKLKIRIRPQNAVVDGVYTEGKFTIRCLSSLGVAFTVLASDYGFEQIGGTYTNGAYSYYRFSNVLNPPSNPVNWNAGEEIEALTLGFNCSVENGTFEIINDAFAQSIDGEYYQELNAAEETGIIYAASVVAGEGNPDLTITQPTVCYSANLNNVLKGEMPTGGTFSYHQSLLDAQNNTNLLTAGQIAMATSGTYGVRYTHPVNGCFVADAITVTTSNSYCVEVDAKVFLQGPYDSLANTMGDALRKITIPPLFPLTEPYSQYNTPAFNFAFIHVNGGGNEVTTQSVLDNTDPNDAIVDWVFLELRNKNDHTQVLATRSALLQRDGDIVDVDGTSTVLFSRSEKDQYYLMVRHRNHLGAMTASTWDFTGTPFIDFSDPGMPTFGNTPTSARKLIETGVYGLLAGNTNLRTETPVGSGIFRFQVKYNGSQNDRVPILNIVGSSTPLNTVQGYYLEDVNLNGVVKYNGSGNDRVIILNNVGSSTPLNVITQEPVN